MNHSTATTAAPAPPNLAAFAFVQLLASELSKGLVELPAFPEVVVRIRRALDDPRSSIEHIAEIVGAEPALAARLMAMANSAAFTCTGKPLADLRSAIIRLGSNAVRAAGISFALAQLRDAPRFKSIAKPLEALWSESTQVAAICYVLAKRTGINPDEAFLAGLLHAMGKLYVLVRAADRRELFQNAAGLEEIIRGWHASIAKAILENWNVPELMVEAVMNQDDLQRKHYGEADLTDVLACAKVLAQCAEDPAQLMRQMKGMDAFRQLRLEPPDCIELLSDAAERIAALRNALGR